MTAATAVVLTLVAFDAVVLAVVIIDHARQVARGKGRPYRRTATPSPVDPGCVGGPDSLEVEGVDSHGFDPIQNGGVTCQQ